MQKMNYNINVLVLVLNTIFTSVTCVNLNVHYNSKLAGNTFRYLLDVPIQRCSDECLARTKCQSFNYVERMRFCELNAVDSTVVSLTAAPGYTFMAISSADRSAGRFQCTPECKKTEVCELELEAARCVVRECPDPPTIQSASVRGNLRHIGARIQYFCDVNYVVDSTLKHPVASSTCLATGTWSEVNVSCSSVCPPGHCEVGWSPAKYIPDNCYKAAFENRTFTGALELCESMNATVLQVNSAAEQRFIVSYGQDQERAHPNVVGYWLALVAGGAAANWRWVYYGTQTQIVYWSWKEVNYFSRKFDESPYVSKQWQYRWEVAHWNTTLFVICEKRVC